MHEVTLPQPVLFVLHRLHEAGYEVYIVGGAVRDILMGRQTKDWDFTTNATPEQIQTVFPKNFYDNAFGTVGISVPSLFGQMRKNGWSVMEIDMWQHQIFEVTTFRKEYGYSDKRRPDHIVWGESLREDLERRDFTINALAISVDDPRQRDTGTSTLNGTIAFARKKEALTLPVKVFDYFDGIAHLKDKLVKTVGSPADRFQEDALRMMRAIRFGSQLGFALEPKTLTAIREHASLLDYVSWERRRDELLKIIGSTYAADGIMLLHSSLLLDYLIPEMLDMRGVKQGGHHIYDVWTHSIESLRFCPSSDPIVRLATLLHDIGKPKTYREQGPRGVTFYGHEVVGARMVKQIGRRLRLANKQIDRLYILVRWHMFVYEPDMTNAAIRRFIKRVGLENINDMMLLRVGDRKGGGSKATSWRLRELQQRIGEQLYEPMSTRDLKVSGHDVMKVLQITPGPRVGTIMNQLFEEVMEEPEKNSRDYLLNRIAELGKAD
jgi:tRNA nucleotidyltransferase (CCA-adding enzyme)